MKSLVRLGLLALAASAMVATVRFASTAGSAQEPDQAQREALINDLLDDVGPLPLRASFWLERPASPGRMALGVDRPAGAFAAADVVLQPGDVGPNFLVASGGEQLRFGISWRTQNLVRAGKNTSFIEPDGPIFVRSFVLQAGDVSTADQAFDQAGTQLFEGVQERPSTTLGERTRAGIVWGDGPFGIAAKLMLFRVRAVVAGVIVAGFEAPTSLDDITPLARIMAARAGRQ